jgi:hypothetical protein
MQTQSVLHTVVIHRFAILTVVNSKIIIFWDVMSCSLMDGCQLFEETCCSQLLHWRWRRQVSMKHWYVPTKLHSAIPQKTILECHITAQFKYSWVQVNNIHNVTIHFGSQFWIFEKKNYFSLLSTFHINGILSIYFLFLTSDHTTEL